MALPGSIRRSLAKHPICHAGNWCGQVPQLEHSLAAISHLTSVAMHELPSQLPRVGGRLVAARTSDLLARSDSWAP